MSPLFTALQRCADTGFRIEIYSSEGYFFVSILQEATNILEAYKGWPENEVTEEAVTEWLCSYW